MPKLLGKKLEIGQCLDPPGVQRSAAVFDAAKLP